MTWNTAIRFFLLVTVFSSGSVTSGQVPDSVEEAMKLENALFQLEVNGDAAGAVELLNIGDFSEQNKAEVLYLRTRCFLEMGEDTKAADTYRELRDLVSADSYWIQRIHRWIPYRFIIREVPWQDGQLEGFRHFLKTDSRSNRTIEGYSLFDLTLQKTDAETSWSIRNLQFRETFTTCQVILDRNSLEVLTMQTEELPIEPIEYQWLGITKRIEGNGYSTLPSSWWLNGLLLQQCDFELGYEDTFDLFSVDSGLSQTIQVSVTSKQLVALPEHRRVPSWIAEVEGLGSASELDRFAFSDESSNALIRFENEQLSVEACSGDLDIRRIAGDQWVKVSAFIGDSVHPQVTAFLGIESGLRLYVLEGNTGVEWLDSPRQQFTFKGDDMKPDVSSVGVFEWIYEADSDRLVGSMLRVDNDSRFWVVFGSETAVAELGNLSPMVALFEQGESL